jgi:hypothetical protein
MAPEQWGDTSKVDWRADLYSLGCVTFEMTCGRVPFKAATIAEACGQHINAQPPKASSLAPTVPAALERLIDQLLEKDPADRPASMREVARAFTTVDKEALGAAPTLTTDPVSLPLPTQVARRSRAVPILLGMLALGGGAAGAIYFFSQPRSATSVAADAALAMAAPVTAPADAHVPASPDTAPPPQVAEPPAPPANPAPPVDAATLAPDAAAPAKTADARPQSKPTKSGSAAPSPGEGTADAEALQQAVRARAAQTNQCYEAALREDSSLSGMVTLQLVIDANGGVTRATADGLTDELRACLITQVRAITFPRPKDPPVSLIVPFRFERE